MRVLDVFFIDEMIGISRIHNDDNPVLNPFLANGKHDFVKVLLVRPFFRFIADKSRNAVNGFQLCRLIDGRSLDTTEHNASAAEHVYYIRTSSFKIFASTVYVYLLLYLRYNR